MGNRELVQYEQKGFELVIDRKTGEAFASQSAVARMVDVSRQAIDKHVGVNQIETIEEEVNTSKGIQRVNLLNESQISQIIKYYSKSKPKADMLLDKLLQGGVRILLHTMAGYTVTSTAVQTQGQKKLPSTYEVIVALTNLENTTMAAGVKQLLIDKCVDEYITYSQFHLAPSRDIWMGVAQRAEELNYKVDESSRSLLGRYVSKQFIGTKSLCGLIERKREVRLCNSQMREIWVYKICDALDVLIHRFFKV